MIHEVEVALPMTESNVVSPPTPEVQRVCGYLYECVGRLLEAISKAPLTGKFEAPLEAWNAVKLIVRNVEGVVLLGQHDLVMLPAAMVLARTAFEISIRTQWLLAPEDPMQREVRWLAWLQEEERFHMRLAEECQKMGHPSPSHMSRYESFRDFRESVIKSLPAGHEPLKRLPTFKEMLSDLDAETNTLHYTISSQYAHGTHFATGHYRRNLGIYKEFVEDTSLADWSYCLKLCWYSLHSTGTKFLQVLGGSEAGFLTPEFGEKLQDSLDTLSHIESPTVEVT